MGHRRLLPAFIWLYAVSRRQVPAAPLFVAETMISFRRCLRRYSYTSYYTLTLIVFAVVISLCKLHMVQPRNDIHQFRVRSVHLRRWLTLGLIFMQFAR